MHTVPCTINLKEPQEGVDKKKRSVANDKPTIKRSRVDEIAASEEHCAASYVRLSDGLKLLLGGQRFCKESEITRDLLLGYLRSKGEIADVNGVVKVTVRPVSGPNFDVALAEGGQHGCLVRSLKQEIEDQQGVPVGWQELFVMDDVGGDALDDQKPLGDEVKIRNGCTLAMSVKDTSGIICKVASVYITSLVVVC